MSHRMRVTRRRALGVLGGTATAVLLAACGGESGRSAGSTGGAQAVTTTGAPAVAAPRERKSLTFVDAFEPKSYVEAGSGHAGGLFAVREGIGEGLVRISFEAKFEPALAAAWEQPDEVTWRFTVRPGVTFHSGQPVTAEAAVFALTALAQSKAAPTALKGATIQDGGGAIVIKTPEPVPYMTAVVADGAATIFDRATLLGDPATTLPVSTGPFRITAFRPGDRRVLEANDAYWGGKPGVSGVQYLFVPEAQTRANQLKTGAADIMRVVNPPDVPALRASPDIQVLTQPLTRVRLLYLTLTKRPMSDLRVRQAIAHAIERQPIVDSVLEGLSTTQVTLFRSDMPWGQDLKGLPYDPNRARMLLEQAGYTAQNPLSITLTTYPSRPELPDIAQVLQQQLKRVGIDLKIQIVDSTVLEPAAKRGELDMTLIARNPLFLYDPQVAFETDYLSGGSYNLSVYSALDDRIKAASRITDANRRYQIYREMEKKIIEEDVATIVLNSYIQIDATRKNISGYRPHPNDTIALTAAIVKS